MATRPRSGPARLRGWQRWPTERLLTARVCDLGLRVQGSPLEARVRQLYGELQQRGLDFRPHVWLSDDWYCPDGVPGIAIPFFLAHPRLVRLEREHLLEVEGAERGWCMRLLRHEAGHALLNAYQLHERRDWRACFGSPAARYPETYQPKPNSTGFVVNLPNWYAQAHPHEDWAETFAVWLRPRFDWRRRYRGWRALAKLEYVDRLMSEIRERRARLRNRREVYPVDAIRLTLGAYYRGKLARYGADGPQVLDRDLQRLFSARSTHRGNEKASRFLRRVRTEALRTVERWTAESKYRINETLNEMIKRCDALRLHLARDEQTTKQELVALLTAVVKDNLHGGGFHLSL